MKKLNLVKLAVSNLRRKMIRTILLLVVAAVVSGTLLSATVFIFGMQNALKIGTYRLGADILVVPAKNEEQARTALLAGKPTSFYMERSVLERIRRVEGVKVASPQIFIQPASFTCCYNVDVFLVAFDPATDFTVMPWLDKTSVATITGDEVIAGRAMPVMTGATIPFFGTPFKVVGTMEPTGMRFFDQSIFMTMDAAYRMAENSATRSMQPIKLDNSKISAVLIKTDGAISPERVALRIMHDIDDVKAIASDEVVNTVRNQLSGLLTGIVTVCGVLWVMGLFMIGFAFYMIVNERQRELGMLRAMGAKRNQVFRLIILEAIIITLVGGILGIGMGFGLLFSLEGVIRTSLQLPYLMPAPLLMQELVVGSVLFSMLTGLVSALLPAFSASRLEPYEAIRTGE